VSSADATAAPVERRGGTLGFERPLGARPAAQSGFDVRIWAPRARAVRIVPAAPAATAPDPATGGTHLVADGEGTWVAHVSWLGHGDRYWVELDGQAWADPWSRSQPDGTAGPSVAVDPVVVGATTPGLGSRSPRPALDHADAVIYELHVGTFTSAGTLATAAGQLTRLRHLGVTHVELLPVGEFPGTRNWGYDGIFWQAAESDYGGPDALVAFVDAAHDAGLGVILDVVYNHVGPTGDPIYDAYGPFFTDRHQTPWGRAVNVDGPGSGAMRETILQSAEWWVGQVGVDGIRVDACHAIVDQSARHILAELTDRVRAAHPDALCIAESGLNDPRTVRPEPVGGWGFDADWADDFHHSLRTLLTNDRQGWYADFGTIADLAKAFHRPYVHDGTWSAYRGRRFGAPADDVDPMRFVVFSQNHDQVGNRPMGDRLPAEVRPLAAFLTLLSPFTPMLFQGEEDDSDTPFQFFSDHQVQLIADGTRAGRRREFADFTAATGWQVPDPQDRATFVHSVLSNHHDPATEDLYRQLLALRRSIPRTPVVTSFDEADRWLRVDRGPFTLLANFAVEARSVPTPPGTIVLATHAGMATTLAADVTSVELSPRSGALIQRTT
jgi:maltooligosyltrehalose trehalohydrolase